MADAQPLDLGAEKPPKLDPAASPAGAAPPAEKRGPGRPKGSTSKKAPTSRGGPSLEKRLGELFAAIGLGVAAVNFADGSAIISGAPGLAKALDKLAAENPAVRRVLEGLLTSSAYGEVVMAVAAIALPIAANHGLLPAAFGALTGAPTPPAGAADPPGAPSSPGGSGPSTVVPLAGRA